MTHPPTLVHPGAYLMVLVCSASAYLVVSVCSAGAYLKISVCSAIAYLKISVCSAIARFTARVRLRVRELAMSLSESTIGAKTPSSGMPVWL